MNVIDRKRGALVGLAVGDALGAAIEFEPYGTFEPVSGFRGGGPHELLAGEWTDDTSMALALAESLAEAGWDLDDQASRYLSWYRTGKFSVNGRVFDIGRTTLDSLQRFSALGDARRAASTDSRDSGNGSIMRLAPIAIQYAHWFDQRLDQLALRGWESSIPTHSSHECLSACAVLATMLAALIQGRPREEVLAADWPAIEQVNHSLALHPAVSEVCRGSYRQLQPPRIQGSGYVVRSLEAALWAFCDAQSFDEAVLRAVNLGDDADTTGAVCGQLAGAYWGESAIPAPWREGLAGRDMIEQALSGLLGDRPTAP